MPTSPLRRIVLVDDDEILRIVLRAALGRAGWTVMGEAGDGAAGVDLSLAAQPEIVLMDLQMPGMGGIEATRAIRAAAPHIEVVMFTATEDRTVFDALKAGAIGYLVKGISPSEVVASLDQVLAGGSPISPRIARLVLGAFMERETGAARAGGTVVELTAREIEILRLLVDGETSASLAANLGISLHTANAHVRNIYRKLEVTSRSQAVSKALREGLL